jgi:hypothetical protein
MTQGPPTQDKKTRIIDLPKIGFTEPDCSGNSEIFTKLAQVKASKRDEYLQVRKMDAIIRAILRSPRSLDLYISTIKSFLKKPAKKGSPHNLRLETIITL